MFGDFNEGDLNALFRGTVIKFNGEPVFIDHAENDKLFAFSLRNREESFFIDAGDGGIDVCNLQTGNVNHKGGVCYVARIPLRRWKQGLCRENLEFYRCGFERDYRAQDAAMGLVNKSFAKMLDNDYPSLTDCLNSLRETNTIEHIAFDREFSVDKAFNVYYKGNGIKVGKVKEDSGKIQFATKHKYLSYALKEGQ